METWSSSSPEVLDDPSSRYLLALRSLSSLRVTQILVGIHGVVRKAYSKDSFVHSPCLKCKKMTSCSVVGVVE